MMLFKEVDFDEPGEIALTNQKTLRKLVGILGMLLPVMLYLFLWIDTKYASPMPSISHYYMTRACGIFVITISLLSIFLMIYKGKEPIDFYLSLFAGVFGLLLLLFPTSNLPATFDCPSCVVTVLKTSKVRPAFHLVCSGLFLGILAFMAIFLFTRSGKTKSGRGRQKRRRNRVFRTCGVTILLSLLLIAGGMEWNWFGTFYERHQLTFWFETLAVEAFGFAWFVKGGAILSDGGGAGDEKAPVKKKRKKISGG